MFKKNKFNNENKQKMRLMRLMQHVYFVIRQLTA